MSMSRVTSGWPPVGSTTAPEKPSTGTAKTVPTAAVEPVPGAGRVAPAPTTVGRENLETKSWMSLAAKPSSSNRPMRCPVPSRAVAVPVVAPAAP